MIVCLFLEFEEKGKIEIRKFEWSLLVEIFI